MDLAQLRQFVAVADAETLTSAAERLGIAQPALSQSMARLEKRLGVRLFDRSRRGTTLTEAGKLLLEDARESVGHAAAVHRLAAQIVDGTAGAIAIGFTSGALYSALPDLLKAAQKHMPQVRLGLHEMSTSEQLAALASGAIDLGFVHSPVPPALGAGLKLRKIADYGLLAAVPQSFARGAKELSLEQIARHGLVLFPENQGIPTRAQIMRAFEAAGLEMRVVQEANRALTVLSCVSAGVGIALVPDWIRALSFEGVRFCNIHRPGAFPRVGLSMAWRGRKTKALVSRLLGLL